MKNIIKYNRVTKKVTKIRRDILIGVEFQMIRQYERLEKRIDKVAAKVNKLDDTLDEIDYVLNNEEEWEVEDIVLEG